MRAAGRGPGGSGPVRRRAGSQQAGSSAMGSPTRAKIASSPDRVPVASDGRADEGLWERLEADLPRGRQASPHGLDGDPRSRRPVARRRSGARGENGGNLKAASSRPPSGPGGLRAWSAPARGSALGIRQEGAMGGSASIGGFRRHRDGSPDIAFHRRRAGRLRRAARAKAWRSVRQRAVGAVVRAVSVVFPPNRRSGGTAPGACAPRMKEV